MRPLGLARLAWWDSFISALLVLAVFVALGALVLLAQWGGRRAALPLLGAAALLLAVTAQSNRARVALAFVGGVLSRG